MTSVYSRHLRNENKLVGSHGQRLQIGVFGAVQSEQLIDYISNHFAFGVSSQETIQSTTGSGAISSSDSMAVLSGGDGSAELRSRLPLRYRPGHTVICGGTCLFSGAGQGYIGLHNGNDGFLLGVNSSTGVVGVTRSFNGEHTTVTELNGDTTALSEIDWGKLNIWRISMGYYGIAPPIFEVLRPNSLEWIPVHTFYTHGILSHPHISIPMLPIRVVAEAGAIVKTASFEAGTMGGNEALGSRLFSVDDIKSITDSSAEILLAAFRSAELFNGKSNPAVSQLLMPSFSCDLDGIVIFRFRIAPSFTNTPAWNPVNSNSVLELSTDAILDNSSPGIKGPGFFIAGGKQISSGAGIDYSRLGLRAVRGDVYAITVQRLIGTVGFNAGYTITYEDLF